MEDFTPLPTRQSESEISDYVEPMKPEQGRRMIRQGLLHFSGHVASVVSGLILVPFMLQRLGAEAYGLWVVALAASGIAAGLDSALYLSVARETSLSCIESRIADGITSSFLTACCGAYIVFGMVCGILLLCFESTLTANLHLSIAVQSVAPAAFLGVAVGFAAGRVVVFGNAVLAGMQRFGLINSISIASVLLRFVGFVLVLSLHPSLKFIAFWYASVSLLECAVMASIMHTSRAVVATVDLFRWRRLFGIRDFAFPSILTALLQNLCWFSPPVLLGIISGSTSPTIPLYAGQRPCFIISDLNWRGAEVIFSAAASSQKDSSDVELRQLVTFGTKCLLAIVVPLCIGLSVLAPQIVLIWLRVRDPQAAAVMRLTTTGIVADAIWVGPLHVLWGRGYAWRVAFITAAVTVSILLLNVALIPRWGPAGSAFAFSVSILIGALVTASLAARELGVPWADSLIRPFSEVLVPSLAMAAFVLTLGRITHFDTRWSVALAALGGGLLYTGLYWVLLRIGKGSDRALLFWFRRIVDRL